MATKEVDGFEVTSGARHIGQGRPIPQIQTRALDGSVAPRWFDIETDKSFRSAQEAHAAANAVVLAVESVDKNGVPHPLAS
ncbi:hypothetical protein [Pusillimonas sp.]|uniref:hypothetical protein n=1 Tax=Pusillimonas sp. TaxID=3040095 RepID=UPI0037C5CB9B